MTPVWMNSPTSAEPEQLLAPCHRGRARPLTMPCVPFGQCRGVARAFLTTRQGERARRACGGLCAEDVRVELREPPRRSELGVAVTVRDRPGVRGAGGGQLALHPLGERRQPLGA